MKIDARNISFSPMIIDDANFSLLKQGQPYQAFRLSDLGENATILNINNINLPVTTCLNNVIVVPGRRPIIGNSINGSGVSFTYLDPVYQYYFVMVNNGSADASVDAMIL